MPVQPPPSTSRADPRQRSSSVFQPVRSRHTSRLNPFRPANSSQPPSSFPIHHPPLPSSSHTEAPVHPRLYPLDATNPVSPGPVIRSVPPPLPTSAARTSSPSISNRPALASSSYHPSSQLSTPSAATVMPFQHSPPLHAPSSQLTAPLQTNPYLRPLPPDSNARPSIPFPVPLPQWLSSNPSSSDSASSYPPHLLDTLLQIAQTSFQAGWQAHIEHTNQRSYVANAHAPHAPHAPHDPHASHTPHTSHTSHAPHAPHAHASHTHAPHAHASDTHAPHTHAPHAHASHTHAPRAHAPLAYVPHLPEVPPSPKRLSPNPPSTIPAHYQPTPTCPAQPLPYVQSQPDVTAPSASTMNRDIHETETCPPAPSHQNASLSMHRAVIVKAEPITTDNVFLRNGHVTEDVASGPENSTLPVRPAPVRSSNLAVPDASPTSTYDRVKSRVLPQAPNVESELVKRASQHQIPHPETSKSPPNAPLPNVTLPNVNSKLNTFQATTPPLSSVEVRTPTAVLKNKQALSTENYACSPRRPQSSNASLEERRGVRAEETRQVIVNSQIHEDRRHIFEEGVSPSKVQGMELSGPKRKDPGLSRIGTTSNNFPTTPPYDEYSRLQDGGAPHRETRQPVVSNVRNKALALRGDADSFRNGDARQNHLQGSHSQTPSSIPSVHPPTGSIGKRSWQDMGDGMETSELNTASVGLSTKNSLHPSNPPSISDRTQSRPAQINTGNPDTRNTSIGSVDQQLPSVGREESEATSPTMKKPRLVGDGAVTSRSSPADQQGRTLEEVNSVGVAGRRNEPETKAQRHERVVQEYVIQYGLLIVERDESGKASWLCCKLCPIVGCTKRSKNYIMAYEEPFLASEFRSHLNKEHMQTWSTFQLLKPEERSDFLKGKSLPDPKAFRNRVAVLKKDMGWRRASRDRKGLRSLERSSAPEIPNKEPILKQCVVANAPPLNQTEMLPANHPLLVMWDGEGRESSVVVELMKWKQVEDPDYWAGRQKFRRDSAEGLGEVRAPFRPNVLPNMEDRVADLLDYIVQCSIHESVRDVLLRGVLSEREFSAFSDEQRGVKASPLQEMESEETVNLTSDGVYLYVLLELNEWEIGLTQNVFFYLLRGMSPQVISDFVSPIPEKNSSGKEENVSLQVSRAANSVCALGLQLLRFSLEEMEYNWAITLTTRTCGQLGTAGVEVLISYLDWADEMHRVHIVSVYRANGAGAAVTSMLDCVCPDWRIRLTGLWSSIPIGETDAKVLESVVFEFLQGDAAVGSDVEVLTESCSPDQLPIYPWVLAEMGTAEFQQLLERHQNRLALVDKEISISSLMKEWEKLKEMKKPEKVQYKYIGYDTAWQMCEKVAPGLKKLTGGLRVLWMADKVDVRESFMGCLTCGVVCETVDEDLDVAVDVGLERVFWARAFMQLRQASTKYIGGETSVVGSRRVCEAWGSNWSNWSNRLGKIWQSFPR